MKSISNFSEPRVKRGTAKQYVVEHLRDQITTGALEPGKKLSLKGISEGFDVSMTPVREAFEQLAVEGLVRIDAYKGARVTELSADEYEEIFLMRIGLEKLAHRLGADKIGPEGCTFLEACLDDMEIALDDSDVTRFLTTDRKFHETIFEAAERPSLARRIMWLRRAAERYTRVAYLLPAGGMEDTLKSHRAILNACRRNDGKNAEKIVTEDLRESYDSFSEVYARHRE